MYFNNLFGRNSGLLFISSMLQRLLLLWYNDRGFHEHILMLKPCLTAKIVNTFVNVMFIISFVTKPSLQESYAFITPLRYVMCWSSHSELWPNKLYTICWRLTAIETSDVRAILLCVVACQIHYCAQDELLKAKL